jgi:hypothetical protein
MKSHRERIHEDARGARTHDHPNAAIGGDPVGNLRLKSIILCPKENRESRYSAAI